MESIFFKFCPFVLDISELESQYRETVIFVPRIFICGQNLIPAHAYLLNNNMHFNAAVKWSTNVQCFLLLSGLKQHHFQKSLLCSE